MLQQTAKSPEAVVGKAQSCAKPVEPGASMHGPFRPHRWPAPARRSEARASAADPTSPSRMMRRCRGLHR
eukprot:scaffold253161_cov23-Tisochrysis_lutea.AAC.2